MDRVVVTDDGRGFMLAASRKRFVPWGFNYDHDATPDERLLEDYWETEWSAVEGDFGEMKDLGATVVRIHLQLGRFMKSASEVDPAALSRLGRLVRLAEATGLRLDVSGLGGYREADVPRWYDALDEPARWAVQARFWEAVAAVCASSPAIFSYDLMNEPAVPAEPQAKWLAPPWMNGRSYVEFVARDPHGRTRLEIAQAWLRTMTAAVRRHDRDHLVTVGLFLVGEQAKNLPLGASPAEIAREVDYLSVHLYPKEGALGASLDVLRELGVGKPVVIEEIGPLECSVESLGGFVEASRPLAAGWFGFYWGETIAEYGRSTDPKAGLMGSWLRLWRDQSSVMTGAPR